MKIVMPRGDLRQVKFAVKDKHDNIVDIVFDEIYITFKEDYNAKNFLFQKKLSDTSITKDSENNYHFKIEPSDTDNLLQNKQYVFDIELIKNDSIKQTFIGTLKLTKEVTFAENEDSNDE